MKINIGKQLTFAEPDEPAPVAGVFVPEFEPEFCPEPEAAAGVEAPDDEGELTPELGPPDPAPAPAPDPDPDPDPAGTFWGVDMVGEEVDGGVLFADSADAVGS